MRHNSPERGPRRRRFRAAALTLDEDAAATARAPEETAPAMGTFRWDASANRVAWSPELYRIYGRTPSQFAGTLEAFLSCVHPDDRRAVRVAVARALEHGEPLRLRGRIVRPDGSVRTLDTAAEIVTDSAGKVSALVGACRDVTDEALAFASLRDLSGQLKRELARERRLIGRELLDATSPILASLYAKLHDRRRPAQDRAELSSLADVVRSVEDLAGIIRLIASDLDPLLSEGTRLTERLRAYAARVASELHVGLVVNVPGRAPRLPEEIQLALFRVVRGFLLYVPTRSGSKHATLRLQSDARELVLEIRDDQRPLPAEAVEELRLGHGEFGVHVAGLREWLRLAGGLLEVTTGSRGTAARLTVPLQRAETMGAR